MLAFYSDDPSSNPPEVYIFSVKLLLKNENKQKETGVDRPIKKQSLRYENLATFFGVISHSLKRFTELFLDD